MANSETILGISLGTRTMGIAVYNNGQLVKWKAKAFYGTWSTAKQKKIIGVLEKVIDHYTVFAIAMKVPSPARSSPELNQLVSTLKKLATQKSIKVRIYSIQELKSYCPAEKKRNKMDLVNWCVEKSPLLFYEYKRIKANHSAYYMKVFEAIVVADLHFRNPQNLPL